MGNLRSWTQLWDANNAGHRDANYQHRLSKHCSTPSGHKYGSKRRYSHLKSHSGTLSHHPVIEGSCFKKLWRMQIKLRSPLFVCWEEINLIRVAFTIPAIQVFRNSIKYIKYSTIGSSLTNFCGNRKLIHWSPSKSIQWAITSSWIWYEMCFHNWKWWR